MIFFFLFIPRLVICVTEIFGEDVSQKYEKTESSRRELQQELNNKTRALIKIQEEGWIKRFNNFLI